MLNNFVLTKKQNIFAAKITMEEYILSDTEKIQLALYVLLSPEYDNVWNQLKSIV